MKKIFFIVLFSSIISRCFSQDDKVGLFKGLNVKSGLTLSYFHNFQGEYYYSLQQNASVVERIKNKDGATLSIVILFPFDDKSKWNFLLNVPLIDLKDISSDARLFNSQTPFGVGLAWFPFKTPNFLGISSMLNIGRQNRMYDDAIKTQFFPIADYPNYKLAVGSPVPEAVLESKGPLDKKTTISGNIGLIIRL